MKYIFGLAGKKQAGKDTAGKFIREHIKEKYGKDSLHTSFAWPMKLAARELLREIYGCEITDEHFYDGPKKEEPLYDRFHKPIMVYDPKYADVKFSSKKLIHASARILYQIIGTQFGRETLNEFIWVQNTWDHIKRVWSKEFDFFTITDFRFPNEINLIKENAEKAAGNFKFVMIRINRPESNVISPDTHASETALDNHPFEYVINNDSSVEELKKKVIDLIGGIIG